MKIVIRPIPPNKPLGKAVVIAPTTITVRARPLRILDFDVEARPLSWISGDYVSKEVTAMAWAWVDTPQDVTCFLLGEDDPRVMLEAFLAAYNQADMVTGHFIRGYDLPMVNGALMEYKLPLLGDKLSHDTKLDLAKRSGISASQESLGAMLRLAHKKVQMNQTRWRDANRLLLHGLAAARERVTGDVQQHIELRQELLRLGYMTGPKLWSAGIKLEGYEP